MHLVSLLLLNASQPILIPESVPQLLSELAFSGMSALHLMDWYREKKLYNEKFSHVDAAKRHRQSRTRSRRK